MLMSFAVYDGFLMTLHSYNLLRPNPFTSDYDLAEHITVTYDYPIYTNLASSIRTIFILHTHVSGINIPILQNLDIGQEQGGKQ